MPDFLQQMAAASRERLAAARHQTPEPLLREQASAAPRASQPPAGFLLVAEVKRISPAAGPLADTSINIAAQAASYSAGGASIISVLTEPTRFGGSLADLQQVAATVQTPVMRKDFLVDPYQILEARAIGASGILLIIKMLDDDGLRRMLACADQFTMFTLIEAFDRDDLDRCAHVLADTTLNRSRMLLGLNTRDLRDLSVRPERLTELARAFPPGYRRIAESGLETPEDVRRAVTLGYDGALIGTALMRSPDPKALCRTMVDAGTQASAERTASVTRSST